MKFRPLRLFAILALAIPGSVAPALAAEQAAAAEAPKFTEEQKTLLKALDSEIGRLEALMAKVEDARYAARRAFGNTTLVKEQVREVWGWRSLQQDLGYAALPASVVEMEKAAIAKIKV